MKRLPTEFEVPGHRARRRGRAHGSSPAGREGRAAGGGSRGPDLLGRPCHRAARRGTARLRSCSRRATSSAGVPARRWRESASMRSSTPSRAKWRTRACRRRGVRAFTRLLPRGSKQFGGGRDEHAPLLAHHYAQAVQPEDADLAWSERARRAGPAPATRPRRGSAAPGSSPWRATTSTRASRCSQRAVELEADATAQAELWREIGRANALGFRGAEFWQAMERSLELTDDGRDPRRDIRRARVPDVVPGRHVDPRSGPRSRLVLDRQGDRADGAGRRAADQGTLRACLLGGGTRRGVRTRGECRSGAAGRPRPPRRGVLRPVARRLPRGSFR